MIHLSKLLRQYVLNLFLHECTLHYIQSLHSMWRENTTILIPESYASITDHNLRGQSPSLPSRREREAKDDFSEIS